MADYLFKDHKPSASQGEARLRGLWRIIYSKTIEADRLIMPAMISTACRRVSAGA